MEQLAEKHKEVAIFVDYARGIASSSFVPNDTAIIISDTMNVILWVSTIARNYAHYVSNNMRGNDVNYTYKSREQLKTIWCKDAPADEPVGLGYLKPSELKKYPISLQSLNQPPSLTEFCNTRIALAIYEYAIYDMQFSIHIVPPGKVNEYLHILAKMVFRFTANNIWITNSDVVSINTSNINDLKKKVINIPDGMSELSLIDRKISSMIILELQNIGWKPPLTSKTNSVFTFKKVTEFDEMGVVTLGEEF